MNSLMPSAPVAGVFHTSEGDGWGRHGRLIDGHRAGLQLLSDREGVGNVGAVHRPTETKGRVVCQPDGLGFVAESVA
jgi:hypothetical protein